MKKCRINLIVGLTALAILVGPVSLGADFTFNKPEIKSNLDLPDLSEIKRLLTQEHIQDEIVVKFKGDVRPFRVVKVPQGEVGERIMEYLKRKDVEYAEPNYIAYALMTPNDPFYNYQWHLDNSVYGGINMEAAWDSSTGSGVIVAIIDTGIAYENYGRSYQQASDLANTCFRPGYDFVYNDSHPNDDNGHGTHVAGTVAQSTNNSLGVAGVAFDSCLMPVKVLNSSGSGSYSDVAEGIRFAADNGAQVINLSLGGSANSNTLRDAVAYAYNKGVTVVAAAGNNGSSSINYPAAYDDYVIAVGATQYDKNLAPYSSYGTSLDLVAPGGNLDLDQNGDGYKDGVLQQTFTKRYWRITWGYYFMEGTSMASPHVAGVAALILANGSVSTPDEVRAVLQETAEDLGTAGRDNTYGYGLVNAYNALNWTTVPNNPPIPNNPPMADNQAVITDEDTAVAIFLTASDSDEDSLTYSIVDGPLEGTLIGLAPSVTYTPNPNYHGSDSFTFKANDGKTDSNIALVSITINPINDAPKANPQSVETTQDTAIAITLSGSDVDEDSLTYSIVDVPSDGALSGTAPAMTYTPEAGYTGSDSFTFKVNDGTVDSQPAIVSITITKINNPPMANDQSVTTDEDTSLNITLTANDPDNDPLTYLVVSSPAKGSLTGIAPNLTYSPELNFNGPDSFTFKVNDGQVDSNLATVSITVNPVNDEPVADSQSVTTDENSLVNIILTASDIDGDSLTYSIVANPLQGTLSGLAPNVTYTPNADYNGSDSFTFKVNDGKTDSNLGTISITINLVATNVCWEGNNQYLYRSSSQMRKFCKCAQGAYGYNSYNYSWGRRTAYRYLDSGDNENWQVTSRSSYISVFKVICGDGQAYLTNQDYYR